VQNNVRKTSACEAVIDAYNTGRLLTFHELWAVLHEMHVEFSYDKWHDQFTLTGDGNELY